MKLYFESGKRQGESVDITPPGISIGRETDNDIQLDEEKVSRYHAKLTQENGIWQIEDLGSSNGTQLNGKTLDARTPLSLNDVIGIGDNTMRFGEESHPAPTTAGAATATDMAPQKRRSLVGPLAMVLLLAIGVAVGGIMMNMQTPGPSPGTGTAGRPQASLDTMRVEYTRYQISDEMVFRYVMSLEDGTLSVTMDDLFDGLHVQREKVLTDDELQRLENLLVNDEILMLESPRALTDTRGFSRVSLAVALGHQGNAVEMVNATIPPPTFALVEAQLRTYAFDVLKIIDLPRQQRLELSREKFDQAHQMYLARTVKPSNLYDSVQAYEYVLLLLDALDERPDYYEEAIRERNEASDLLDKTLTELKNRGDLHQQARNLPEARAAYQEILSMVPDKNHPANKDARVLIQYVQSKMDRDSR